MGIEETPEDYALVGTDAIKAFVEQFGSMDDIVNRIIMEEVLKELFGIKDHKPSP
jgi:hypothetical protein